MAPPTNVDKGLTKAHRFPHAGTMITRGHGTASSKTEALREVGTTVLEFFSNMGMAAKEIPWGEGYQT